MTPEQRAGNVIFNKSVPRGGLPSGWADGLERAIADEIRKAVTEACEQGRREMQKQVREVFTRRLGLDCDQRAYSWHQIQDALEEIERPIK